MTMTAPDGTDYRAALTDLLNYCRDARHTLSIGHALGPILLKDDAPSHGAAWTIKADWMLVEQMKLLLAEQLENARRSVGIVTPVSSDPIEHGPALKADLQQNRRELKFWSVLWAYYICAMTHDEMTEVCGWSRRTNELTLKQGRETYLLQKLAELEPRAEVIRAAADQPDELGALAESSASAAERRDPAAHPPRGRQSITNNSGIAIMGDVTGSSVQQYNHGSWTDDSQR